MLCYAKLYNCISENNNNWINADIKEIFRAARISVKYRNDKFLYLNDLEKIELISFSNKNDNLNIRVNFVEMDGEHVFIVGDFRELGYEYLNYIGDGEFIRCTECERLIKKTNNKCLYCIKCAKEKKNIQNKKYYKEKFRKIENA